MREQVFKYVFTAPKDGSTFVCERHLNHAIGNSDQYPFCPPYAGAETEGKKVQEETLQAAVNAIAATPKYAVRERSVVDRWAMVSRLIEEHRDGLGEKSLSALDVIMLLQAMAEDALVLDRAPVNIRESACDGCETGKARGCGHAEGRHYDAWGEGLGSPNYCPQKGDGLPW